MKSLQNKIDDLLKKDESIKRQFMTSNFSRLMELFVELKCLRSSELSKKRESYISFEILPLLGSNDVYVSGSSFGVGFDILEFRNCLLFKLHPESKIRLPLGYPILLLSKEARLLLIELSNTLKRYQREDRTTLGGKFIYPPKDFKFLEN